MATLIDDGLVESYLDHPVRAMDFDQFKIIDVDNIDAIIEDPGYILDEDPNTFDRNDEYTSSYNKRSSTLPVTFFDISRNISLLKKCRPISIKIVDCDIYPWYYKRYNHINNTNSDVSSRYQVSNVYKFNNDITDKQTSAWSEKYINDPVASAPPIGSHKINLTLEQRSVILKLKEEIDNQFCTKEDSARNDNLGISKITLKNNENSSLIVKKTTQTDLYKRIEPYDLLTYKEIAQTIVRNIDYIEPNNNAENTKSFQNPSINEIRHNIQKVDRNKPEQKKGHKEITPTSPILPNRIKRQKKTKSKQKMLEKLPAANNIFEKYSEYNKNCDKLMHSSNQVIPHYHYNLPIPINNYKDNFNYPSVAANQMHREQVTNYPTIHLHQPINEKGAFLSNNDSIPVDDSHGRLVTSTSSIGQISYLDFNKELLDDIHYKHITSNQSTLNMNPNFHTSDRQFQYLSSYYQNAFNVASEGTNQSKVTNSSSLRFVRRPSVKQISKENFRVFPQPSAGLYNNYIPNSMSLLNDYVNYSTPQIPLQRSVGNMTNIIQNNPLLSQLLNYNNQRDYYRSISKQCDGLDPVAGQMQYSSMGQNTCVPFSLPPPPPSFECHLPSTQFNQIKNVQYPNTTIHYQSFSNIEEPNLPQHQANSSMNPNDLINNYKCIKNVPIDSPNVTISITPKIDSFNPDVCKHIENMSLVSPKSRRIGDPKALININAEVDHQSIGNVSIKDTKSNNVDVQKKDELKINGYSPPILPIPSFKKSLEMLSESQYSPLNLRNNNAIEIETQTDACVTSEERRKSQEFQNIIRKRKLNDDKMYINSKRISLQEYKLRRSEHMVRMM